MITIEFEDLEFFDGESFITYPSKSVNFEYSLLAISKWESKWKIPFLDVDNEFKPNDERLIDFCIFMAMDDNVSKEYFTNSNVVAKLSEYMKDSYTATKFSQNEPKSYKKHVHTAEELYAMMFLNSVPLEFEKRNLNTLLTVLRIIGIYQNPKKNMPNSEVLKQNTNLNQLRKKQLNTRG